MRSTPKVILKCTDKQVRSTRHEPRRTQTHQLVPSFRGAIIIVSCCLFRLVSGLVSDSAHVCVSLCVCMIQRKASDEELNSRIPKLPTIAEQRNRKRKANAVPIVPAMQNVLFFCRQACPSVPSLHRRLEWSYNARSNPSPQNRVSCQDCRPRWQI